MIDRRKQWLKLVFNRELFYRAQQPVWPYVVSRAGTERLVSHCFPVTPWVIVYCGVAVFLQNFFVCSVTEPVYYLILTSACYCCAFNWMRSMLLQVYSWDWQRIENHGQSAFCLLTFFFWAPLISFERESWLQPCWGSLPGVMAGSDQAQKCLLLLHSCVLPVCCMAATTAAPHAAWLVRIYMCAN